MEEEKIHPLDTIGEEQIKKAYSIAKFIFVLMAIGAIAAGIVLCVLSTKEVPTTNGYRTTTERVTDAGMVVGGILTMILGPIVIALSWYVFRLVFKLIYDVSVLRDNLCPEEQEEQEKPSDFISE